MDPLNPAQERRSWKESAFPAALFGLLVLTIYADPLFFRRNFAGRDLLIYNFPMEKAIHDAYASGRLPIWMPEVSGGRPLLPNPNAGALYPLRALLSVTPFTLALRLFPILHWIAAGVGMILLLRSIGGSRAAAWVGAVTYVFSGVGVAHVFFPNLHPGMTLLPWICWALQRPASAAGRVLGLSFLYGLIFLAGDVFTIGMALASSCLWIAVETPRPEAPRKLAQLAASLALAGLLASPQILATFLWLPETNRAVLGMKLHESLFFSVHPLRLIELVVPFPFGANWTLQNELVWGWPVFRGKAMGMFTSLYAGGFALVALVSTWRARSRGFRFGRILFLLSLAVSILPSLIPSAWEKLPSPLPLRNPEKFSVALLFSLAVLSGLAFDRLRAEASRRRWPLGVAALLTVVAAGTFLFPEKAGVIAVRLVGARKQVEQVASEHLPAAFAEGALFWAATVVALDRLRRASPSRVGVSVVLLTAVPILANHRIAFVLSEQELFSPTPFARFVERADPRGAYRTLSESLYLPPSPLLFQHAEPSGAYIEAQRWTWGAFLPALWGRGTVFNHDFDSGDFVRMENLRKISVTAAGFTDSAPFFAGFALRWGIRFRDQNPPSGYRRLAGNWIQDWDELPEALPDIRLASSWIEESRPLAVAADLPQLKLGEIVLETGRQARGVAPPGIVRVLRKDPERLIVETVTARPSWLFVLRGFWSHRTVLIDGRPVEAVPAQLAFSAVGVPAGRHRFDWKERVPGGSVSRWGPVFYTVAAAILAIRCGAGSSP